MRIRGTFFELWCAAVLALASAQQQVEFPLDYYSFAEIANGCRSTDGASTAPKTSGNGSR